MTRVLTTYGTELIAIDSRASISSLMRMAPICAVEPAPIVADRPIPAMTGAAIRTLMKAEKNPVSASTPIFPSELKPWIAMVPPEARVRNPTTATVPPITAKAPVPMLISATSLNTSLGCLRIAHGM